MRLLSYYAIRLYGHMAVNNNYNSDAKVGAEAISCRTHTHFSLFYMGLRIVIMELSTSFRMFVTFFL